MTEDVVSLNRLAATFGHAAQFDEDVITIFCGAAFDRNVCCCALAQLFESLVDLRIAGLNRVNLNVDAFVIAEIEFGKHLKDCAEAERFSILEFNFVYFGPGNGNQILFAEGLLQVFGNKGLDYFTLNIVRESPTDQCDRRFTGTESRHARHTREVFRDLLSCFLNVVSRNFQLELTLAVCFSHLEFFGESRD